MPVDDLLDSWLSRARKSQFAHYRTARHLARLNYQFGLPAAILSAIVGTSIFVSLEKTPSITLRVIFGLVSILAATLSASQTFMRFAERAEKHRAAGATFGAIRREIEQFKSIRHVGDENIGVFIDSIRKRFDELATHSPEIPEKTWDEVEKMIDTEETAVLLPQANRQ